MPSLGAILELPPLQLFICYLHYKTLRNSRINGYCLLYIILIAIPAIKDTSFSCVGQYAMMLLRCIDIQLMDPSITKKWNLETYIRVFWTSQTKEERKKDLKIAFSQSDSIAKLMVSSQVDLRDTNSFYWLSFMFTTTWQLLAFIWIPAYFYVNQSNWDPIPFELLDYSNPSLIFNYGLYLILIYSSIVLSRSVYGHAISYIYDIPYRNPMLDPWSSTSLSQFWGLRWNGTVQGCLKRIGYDPIKSLVGGLQGHLLASLAAFGVSALVHEYALIGYTGSSSLEQLTFFIIQYLFLIVEGLMIRTIDRLTGVNVSRDLPWLGWAYTMTILLWTCPLMLNPYIRSHAFFRIVPFGYISDRLVESHI